MNNPYARAPHIESPNRSIVPAAAPNAALLIDFDNVTMGMRSDLSRELKSLLNSDIIKGKVTVQRAYADWRRYPQYIVPLSEASIDLIFAPAYGSSKKNATDIRMAIDGMELVFTRPEIGTYILLTGDSDFSSLVLKLKEYGKYVIGVGIQESSSDILVQNCDEYYSYTSLSGLRRTSDGGGASPLDPWVLVEKAVEQMTKRSDVMRSDRLKQVMLEMDPGFDEKSFGFTKFSRFLSEASSKGLIQLQKMENGQYEIVPKGGGKRTEPAEARGDARKGGRGRDRGDRGSESNGRGRSQGDGPPAVSTSAPTSSAPEPTPPSMDSAAGSGGREALDPAYALMVRALTDLLEDQEVDSVRDSDVKRRMLALDGSFNESELGFSKFSLFLRQAHDHGVILLEKGEEGNYHVSPGAGVSSPAAPPGRDRSPSAAAPSGSDAAKATRAKAPVDTPTGTAAAEEFEVKGGDVRRLRPRLSTRRGGEGALDLLLEGQVVTPPGSATPGPNAGQEGVSRDTRPGGFTPSAPGEVLAPEDLRLPTDRESVIQYLTNSYKGVGKRTAEIVLDAFDRDLFRVLQTDPKKVVNLLPPARAERLLEGWEADFARRRERVGGGKDTSSAKPQDGAPSHLPGSGESSGEGAAPEGEKPRRPRRTRGGRSSR